MNLKKMSITSVVLCAVIFGAVLWLTQPLTSLADDYFVLVSQGKIDQAYQLTSNELKSQHTLGDFQEILTNSPLTKYKGSSWSSRTIENDTGNIQGVIKTTDPIAPKLNAEMNFIKENGQWKIRSLETW